MKNFNYIFLSCALIVSAIFTSCEDNTPDTPEYKTPDFTINGAVGTEITSTEANNVGTITFVAEGVWTVTVDKSWIELDIKTGGAGEYTINYTIDGRDVGFDDTSEGAITFVMGNVNSQIKVIRNPKERKIDFMGITEEGGELLPITSVDVKYNADDRNYYIVIDRVNGNFDWSVVELPKWISGPGVDEDGLDLSYSGKKDQDVVLFMMLNPEGFVAGAPMTGDIVFGSSGKEFTKALTVKFEGVDSEFISVNGTLPLGARLSYEGYVVEGLDNVETEKLGYDFKIIAADPEVGIISFAVDPKRGLSPFNHNSWVNINEVMPARSAVVTSNYTLRAKLNTGLERTAEIYILSKSALDKIGGIEDAPWEMLYFDETDGVAKIKPEYEKYYMSTITQEALSGPMFTLGGEYGDGSDDAELVALAEGSPEFELYGTKNISTLNLGPKANFSIITTLGYSSELLPLEIVEVGEPIYDAENGEPSLDGSSNYYFTFTWRQNATTVNKKSVLMFKYVEADAESGVEIGDNYGVLILTQEPSADNPE